MGADFVIKKGDLLPKLRVTLVDADGDAVDITGQVGVVFTMTLQGEATPKIDEAACTIVTENPAVVEYEWAGTDTDSPGSYDAEFEVDFGGGVGETFPNGRHMLVLVNDTLS